MISSRDRFASASSSRFVSVCCSRHRIHSTTISRRRSLFTHSSLSLRYQLLSVVFINFLHESFALHVCWVTFFFLFFAHSSFLFLFVAIISLKIYTDPNSFSFVFFPGLNIRILCFEYLSFRRKCCKECDGFIHAFSWVLSIFVRSSSVSMYQFTKSLVIPAQALLQFFWMRIRLRPRAIFSIGLICLGVAYVLFWIDLFLCLVFFYVCLFVSKYDLDTLRNEFVIMYIPTSENWEIFRWMSSGLLNSFVVSFAFFFFRPSSSLIFMNSLLFASSDFSSKGGNSKTAYSPLYIFFVSCIAVFSVACDQVVCLWLIFIDALDVGL